MHNIKIYSYAMKSNTNTLFFAKIKNENIIRTVKSTAGRGSHNTNNVNEDYRIFILNVVNPSLYHMNDVHVMVMVQIAA